MQTSQRSWAKLLIILLVLVADCTIVISAFQLLLVNYELDVVQVPSQPTLHHHQAQNQLTLPSSFSSPLTIFERPNSASSFQQYLALYLLSSNEPILDQSNYDHGEITSSSSSPTPTYSFNLDNITLNSNKPPKKENDEIVRIIDANTIKLKLNGLVTLAAVNTPSGYNDQNFRFPDCFTKSPSSKLRQLLPSGTKVSIVFVDEDNNNNNNNTGSSRPRAVLMEVHGKTSLVNTDLVREGFAKPVSRGRAKSEQMLPGLSEYLSSLQQEAKDKGNGIYKRCDDIENIATDDQFEALDVTTEIVFGDDGGKVTLKYSEKNNEQVVPPNPGDKRGCSDFRTYEDALRYYETYYPYYGDIAKLDRDGDGIPCSGLPHTTNQSKYRVKKALIRDATATPATNNL